MGKSPLDVAQRGDGMDDQLGEPGRKGVPVSGRWNTRLDCAGRENKKIWDAFCLESKLFWYVPCPEQAHPLVWVAARAGPPPPQKSYVMRRFDPLAGPSR